MCGIYLFFNLDFVKLLAVCQWPASLHQISLELPEIKRSYFVNATPSYNRSEKVLLCIMKCTKKGVFIFLCVEQCFVLRCFCELHCNKIWIRTGSLLSFNSLLNCQHAAWWFHVFLHFSIMWSEGIMYFHVCVALFPPVVWLWAMLDKHVIIGSTSWDNANLWSPGKLLYRLSLKHWSSLLV